MLSWQNIQRDGSPLYTANWRSGKKQGRPPEPSPAVTAAQRSTWPSVRLHRGLTHAARKATTSSLFSVWKLLGKPGEHLLCGPFHCPGHREHSGQQTNFDKTSRLCQIRLVNSHQRQAPMRKREPRAKQGREATQRTVWRRVWGQRPGQDPRNLSFPPCEGAQVWKDPDHNAGPLWGEDISEANQVAILNITRARTKSHHYYFIKSSSLSLRSPKTAFLKWNKN